MRRPKSSEITFLVPLLRRASSTFFVRLSRRFDADRSLALYHSPDSLFSPFSLFFYSFYSWLSYFFYLSWWNVGLGTSRHWELEIRFLYSSPCCFREWWNFLKQSILVRLEVESFFFNRFVRCFVRIIGDILLGNRISHVKKIKSEWLVIMLSATLF